MKKIIRNSVSALLLALAVAVTQIPVHPVTAASDFLMDNATLVKYTGTEKSVSIPNTVKRIGEEAFYDCDTIESITIPGSVKEISYGAFSECSNLKQITIPNNVEVVGNSAFSNCTSLQEITIGKNVKEWGNGVFAGCNLLDKISVAKKNEHFLVEDGVLYNKDKSTLYQMLPNRQKEVYTMPNTVTKIKPYAFWDCSFLKDVTLGNKLEEISAYSFANCKSLESITIPYSVKSIDLKAFADCINLGKVSIPLSVNQIHSTAFDGCYQLEIEAEENSVAAEFYDEFKKRDMTEYETTGYSSEELAEDSDEEYNGAISYTIDSDGDGVLGTTSRIVGDKAILYIDNSNFDMRNGAYQIKLENMLGVSENAESDTSLEEEEDGITLVLEESDEKGFSLPKYTIVNDTLVAEQAFYRDEALTSYEIPAGITEIGEFAFARSRLTSIRIPNGVTKIGYGAFYHCDNLSDIQFPSSVTEIAPEAFSKTAYLEDWKNSSNGNFLIVGDGILLAYKGDYETVTIPEGIKYIASCVFKNHSEIRALYLPDSLESIGEEAFMNCSRLTNVSGGAYIKEISDRAFWGCPLKTIRIPDTVEKIGLGAYNFTDTDKKNYEKTVVFHGTTLPDISVGESAKRLSNKEYRTPAFTDVMFAVVEESVSLETIKNSPIFSEKNGFKGIVCSINSKNEEYAVCRYTNLSADEINRMDIPEAVVIYGDEYRLLNRMELLSEAKNDTSDYPIKEKLVIRAADEIKPVFSGATAVLEGNDDAYYLSAAKGQTKELQPAYNLIYHENLPDNTVVYDFSLKDYKTDTDVEKLGKRSVTITMPVPAGLTVDSLRIITIDSDGQLENIDYNYKEDGSIEFKVNHFSAYGFYSYETENGQNIVGNKDGELTKASKKDDSPDTGDWIHPKYFLAIGFLFASVAVFFQKKHSKKTSGI